MSEVIVEHYRLIRPLGQGGSGVTYLAEDLNDGQHVVVKQFHMAAEGGATWSRESQLLKKLDHGQLPKYIDGFVAPVMMVPRPHLVQEYIEGHSLKTEMSEISYTSREALRIAADILSILAYLQSINPPVIHRDIKPSNILRRFEDRKLCLIDFGAAIASENRTFGHTLAVGTIGYQAPEQIAGEPCPASDVYSVGVVLLELLTGISPNRLLSGQNLQWQTKAKDFDAEIVGWLSRALAKNPANRFASAAEGLEAIYKLLPRMKRINIPSPSFQAPITRNAMGASPVAMERRLEQLELQASSLQEWTDIAQGWQEILEDQRVEQSVGEIRTLLKNDDFQTQIDQISHLRSLFGQRNQLVAWADSLEARAKGPAQLGQMIDLWHSLGQADRQENAEDRRQMWFSKAFQDMAERFEKAGLAPELPHPPHTIQELEDWKSLESRWVRIADEVMLESLPFGKRIARLNRLIRSVGIAALSSLLKGLEERINNSRDLLALSMFYKGLGDFEKKESLMARRQKWLLKKRDAHRKRVMEIGIVIPPPREPLDENTVERYQKEIHNQLQRHQQALELDSEARRLSLSAIQWATPYTEHDIRKRRQTLDKHSKRADQLGQIKDRARRIQWDIELPKPPYSPQLIRDLEYELQSQTDIYQELKSYQSRAMGVMGWAPGMPDAPYRSRHPKEYREKVDFQIEKHDLISQLWMRMGSDGRKLIKKPKPPYSDGILTEFIEMSKPLLNSSAAKKILMTRRIRSAAGFLILGLIPLFLWQRGLSLDVASVQMRAKALGLELPFPDSACDSEHRSTDACPMIEAPTFPYSKGEVAEYANEVAHHRRLISMVDGFRPEAESLGFNVDAWIPPFYRDQVLEWRKKVKAKDKEAEDVETLRLRAQSIGMDTSQWSPPYSIDQLIQWRRQITTSEQLSPQIQSLYADMERLNLPAVRLSPPYFQSDYMDLQLRVRQVPQIRQIFGKSSKSSMEGGTLRAMNEAVFVSRPFEIMSTEVSQNLFFTVMGENPSHFSCTDCPVERVSFLKATEFANRLSWAQSLPECYVIQRDEILWENSDACLGWRLPTESEWKFALSAPSPSAESEMEQSPQPQAKLTLEFAWIAENSGGKTKSIGQNLANSRGVFGLHGNVSEWVWKSKKTQAGMPLIRTQHKNPERMPALGGCWNSESLAVEKPHSRTGLMGEQNDCIGFRLIRSLSDSEMRAASLNLHTPPKDLDKTNDKLESSRQNRDGHLFLLENNLSSARKAFELSLTLNPGNPIAMGGLAQVIEEEAAKSSVKDRASLLTQAISHYCRVLLAEEANIEVKAHSRRRIAALKGSCNEGSP